MRRQSKTSVLGRWSDWSRSVCFDFHLWTPSPQQARVFLQSPSVSHRDQSSSDDGSSIGFGLCPPSCLRSSRVLQDWRLLRSIWWGSITNVFCDCRIWSSLLSCWLHHRHLLNQIVLHLVTCSDPQRHQITLYRAHLSYTGLYLERIFCSCIGIALGHTGQRSDQVTSHQATYWKAFQLNRHPLLYTCRGRSLLVAPDSHRGELCILVHLCRYASLTVISPGSDMMAWVSYTSVYTRTFQIETHAFLI